MTMLIRAASNMTRIGRVALVFLTVVATGIGTYLWQSRESTIALANVELQAAATDAMYHLSSLVTAADVWGQALKRFQTFYTLQRSGARDVQFSGHILDIVDQNPTLAGIAILDAEGIVQFASDGSPGRFPYMVRLDVPDLANERMFGTLGPAIPLPFVLNAQFQVWRPVTLGDERLFYVFFISDLALREILRSAEARGYVSTALLPEAEASLSREDGFALLADTHPLLSGHNTIVARMDVGRRVTDAWQPKALIGGGAVVASAALTVMVLFLGGLYQRRAERAEAESVKVSTWLGTLLSAASDAILVVADDQSIVVANDAAHAVFGWEPGSLNGLSLNNLVPTELQSAHALRTSSFFRGGQSMTRMGDYRHVHGIRKDGTEFPIMVSLGYARIGDFRYAVAIARDMTAVEEINRQLTAMSLELSVKLEEAQAASAAKLRFLASMSHELRTPLNAIIGFSEILKTDTMKLGIHPTYSGYAKDINNSGMYLLNLINDILEISKHGTGKVALNPEQCTVAELIDLPVRNLSLIGKNANIDVKVSVHEPSATIFVDNRAVRQCIFNVLGNAIKFSPPFSTVEMEVSFDASKMQVRIVDAGPGIPKEDLPRITRPFERGGDPYISQHEGAGLGLAITKDLLEIMGGCLQIHSELGKGTTVLMSFPIHDAQRA